MMNVIADTIEKIRAEMAMGKTDPVMVSDRAVAEQIKDIASYGYEPSEQDVEPIRAYLSGYGLLLTGRPGVGKTFLMRCLGARLHPVDGIAAYGLRGIGDWYSWTDGKDLCIDDLGAEPVIAEYGAKEDLMKLVIAHRAERQKGRTSVTTNLTSEEIAERYGDRTLSRLLGMCKAFKMIGTNKRGPDAARKQIAGAV